MTTRPRTTNRSRPGKAGKVIGWTALVLMVLFSALAATELYYNPLHSGYWAVGWVFGGLTFIIGGHLFGILPRTPAANGLLVAIFLLGFFVVPVGLEFVLHWNMAVGIIVAPFAVAFALALRQYLRMVHGHPRPGK